MRHYKSYITIALAACTLFFVSCSDEYMENMNTDPSKADNHRPQRTAHHCPASYLWRFGGE